MKIVKISIDNYKAYIQKEIISLPNGENLLIYGENGSGKSSLFNALKHFLLSSRDSSAIFDLNVFSGRHNGSIELSFKDYDVTSKKLLGSEVSYLACESAANSTNAKDFIKLAHQLSGFLDYSQLLKVYLNKGIRPNLFNLINDLIGEYALTNYGSGETLKQAIDSIHNNIHKSYHRKDKSYTLAKNNFLNLQSAYPQIINDLNQIFCSLMSKYFPNFKLGLHLNAIQISLDENRKIKDMKIEGAVYIDVTHHGVAIPDYNSHLNEARLSAIAVCLYLASLKMRNQNAEIKVLHLDDVFIGLDSSNRRPILNILNEVFSDYQIIISTYDKSWYSLAKEILNDKTRWKHIELYEGETEVGGHKVVKPVIVEGCTFIDKAKVYLFDQEKPDYPAAANYMRKAFEELLTKEMYPAAVKDDNLENIPGYKIPKIIDNSRKFLRCLPDEPNAPIIIGLLDQLMTYLKPMLHPLSHYAPGEPVYKKELIEALDIFERLSAAIKAANYISKLKPILTRDSIFKFEIEGKNWKQEYMLHTDYDMYKYEDVAGNQKLSLCHITATNIKETNTTTKNIVEFSVNKRLNIRSNFEYDSIDDCIAKITAYLKSDNEKKTDYIILHPITDMFFLPKNNPITTPEITYSEKLTSILRQHPHKGNPCNVD